MKPQLNSFLYWSPRVLGILFALFLNVFALDVFAKSRSFWLLLAALLLHSIPTILVVITLIIAWRWELAGGIIFLLQAVGYAVESRNNPPAMAAISGPLLLTGLLFIVNWYYRKTIGHARNKAEVL